MTRTSSVGGRGRAPSAHGFEPPRTAPLRIAVLAHVRHPIRAPFEGGVEAHTWHLVRGLAARGHAVTLYASGDSDAGGELVPIVDEHYERRLPWARYRDSDALRTHLDAVFARAWDAIGNGAHDVVHNNTLHPLPIERARAAGVPMLTSLHVPPFPRLRDAIDRAAVPQLRFSVTSRRQHATWRDAAPSFEPCTVCNGIDVAAWPYRAAGDGSAVWAGRITPNKGTHLAIDAARRAGVALSIVGAVEDRDYFERQVAPALSDTIRHVGHLRGDALAALFGRASVLLFTPLWEEPFGLVAIEAMACGLPVAYVDRGAAREVVGEAGVAADGEDGAALAAALARAIAIPRERPRRRVERRFTLERMLDGYERLYRDCIAGAAALGTTALAPTGRRTARPEQSSASPGTAFEPTPTAAPSPGAESTRR